MERLVGGNKASQASAFKSSDLLLEEDELDELDELDDDDDDDESVSSSRLALDPSLREH